MKNASHGELCVKSQLRAFILKNYLADDNRVKLGDNDSFLNNGIIDSIGVIELVQFIREKYDIDIKVPEIIPDNFDTLNNLEKYINKKMGIL